jgi:hypothetical protein
MLKLALVLGVAALVASPSFAQPGRRGGGFGPGALLRVEKVQKDMGLDKEKVDKANAALAKVREDLKDDYDKLGFQSQASQDERAAARKKTGEAEEKALKDVLSEKQMTRLHQIQRQLQGIDMFQNEEVQKTLKLTDDQKAKLKEINDDLRKETQELFQGGGGFKPENVTKMQALRKDALASAMKALDDTQKKAVKEMTGEPIELTPQDLFPGRGKPGGGKPDKPRTDF